MSPLDALLDHLRGTAALEQAAGLLSWDQETMMPPKGGAQRAAQAGALAAAIHARNADPRLADWIAAVDRDALDPAAARNVAEAERAHRRATRIPAALAQAIAVAASEGQRVWAAARAASDFAAFAPALARVVALQREAAGHLTDGDPYDALLDDFEPGATVATLGPMLESLRAPLVALRARIAERPAPPRLAGAFPPEAQMALARRLAAAVGYDFDAGRLDRSVHPFSAGVAGDARITTRTDPADPLDCVYSTLHETGHALYAQGAPDPFLPAAQFASMGAHESQSRFWENQIGRARPFMDRLAPALREAFPDAAIPDPDALHRIVNRVETGFIRTEADEVHYNLHVLMRFDLERDLIAGRLAPADLEAAWNDRFARDFGLTPPDAARGCLQDVHWSVGLFGYFPTYALGNVYAACLDAAMRAALPDRDAMVRAGDFAPILGWLRARVHAHGRIQPAPALIEAATGAPVSVAPLVDYLETKFGALYDL